MFEIKTLAFVLEKKTGYKNEGHLLLLTEERGLVWVTAEGVLKSGAKLTGWTDPPVLISANLLFLREKTFFGKILNLSQISHFSEVRTSYSNLSWYFFYVFLIKNFLIEGISDAFYFKLLKECLSQETAENSWLKAESRDLNFIYFFTKVLQKEGICPDWQNCASCGVEFSAVEAYFLPSFEQGLICGKCLKQTASNHFYFQQNVSLQFLKILPEKNQFSFPRGAIRVRKEERELLVLMEKNDDLNQIFANSNSSLKINNQTKAKVRNFLLLFLGTVI